MSYKQNLKGRPGRGEAAHQKVKKLAQDLPMTYHYAKGQKCIGEGKAAASLSSPWRYPPLGSCVSHPGTYILVSLRLLQMCAALLKT